MNQVVIGNKIIAADQPPFIIAEAGINHNGDLATAYKMIDTAKAAGVDAVKFQTFKAEEFCGDAKQMFTYQSQGKEITEPMLDMFKRMEFSVKEWHQIKLYCDKQKIMFLSTPQNPSDLKLLLEIGIDAIKIGSDDLSNIPLLKTYRAANLPMIISCGMADMADVYLALETLNALDGYPVILCLCTSQYPTPAEDINLEKLTTLRNAFPMLTLGFSDHSQGILASSLAVAYGACLFEKHFTLSNDMPGPDHWFSENPESLKQWRDAIHTAHIMKGSGIIRPSVAEQDMRTLARRSIVALSDIKEGDTLDIKNIGLRRPGNGLPPALFENILGLKANKSIKKGDLLAMGNMEN
ncbi:N-acetylneuraminate synthase family protein [Pseudoalteromonas denitrificans]|jgi:sialic acid synthase SpsE|uniref:N-acetylneuraminate synthase n=1 Tax=Pseudoalteromonas denitrificans DSM 6059 TaxID=1123010 RepID=A0A1I1HK90_9GAMM|nr:N-acetylneuraminate synthase family protein [Pseudoalteromonas denitrificans]SFC24165.1 N-acetylneuraminate synthase [Pseudoalteromonas denitrificans DSM 6059]